MGCNCIDIFFYNFLWVFVKVGLEFFFPCLSPLSLRACFFFPGERWLRLIGVNLSKRANVRVMSMMGAGVNDRLRMFFEGG